MTAGELKKLLADEPDDKLIVIHGYEGEYDDINMKRDVQIIPNGNKNIWYYGTHVEIHEKHTQQQKDKAVTALLLT